MSTRADLLSATGQFCWPPVGSYLSATGQFLMAADSQLRRNALSEPSQSDLGTATGRRLGDHYPPSYPAAT